MKLRLIIILASALFLMISCAEKTDTLLIKEEKFNIKTTCEGRGIFYISMKNKKLTINALDKILYSMDDPSNMTLWCHGSIHQWQGKVKYGYYTFISSKNDPLQFIVDKNIGYYYIKGTGKVITPEGKKLKLQLPEGVTSKLDSKKIKTF
ncbi:MAG: hypothetical protein JXB50_06960 [Spirochaetes bacterium]|nr:hypothetical protein [Spirochaetota bacterium]